ncbi:MAG: NAD(P)/FAD-dependent oxidoreductase [Bacteroidales bacterium]|nr:NAD(P)/FAD-dependent oxidoreductase [Bacteroidales bacterium]
MSSAVIIGAGLGGLQTGYMLAREGFGVTVLEKNPVVGGCLQSFRRRGVVFDTGMHYVGALGPGETMRPVMEYYGLMDLPWVQMDPECVDEVVIDGESFALPSGYGRFTELVGDRFPAFRSEVAAYVRGIREAVADPAGAFRVNAFDWLNSTVSDPLLRKVLSGASLRLDQDAATLPLYVYARITDSFLQSGWRLRGGGQQLVDSLARGIESMGGRVITGCEVVSIDENTPGKASVSTLKHGSFEADWVVSDLSPSLTMNLASACPSIKNIYRRRVSSLRSSWAAFTLQLHVQGMPYVNHNIHIHNGGADPWSPAPFSSFMVSYGVPEGNQSETIDIITPMAWEDVAQWEGTAPLRRGKDYAELKENAAQRCLEAVSGRLPGLREAIRESYSSTPLTWQDYTGSPCGSAFGILKDSSNLLLTMLSPRTPIQNLVLTGQNLHIHGIFGVSMTTLATCREITAKELSYDI